MLLLTFVRKQDLTPGMKRTAALLVFLAFFVAGARRAATQGPAPAAPPFRVQDHRLRNGLRVVLSEDSRLPLVTVAVAYGAGTLREKPGQEGLAYLLENLMFQGSENISPLQHIAFIQRLIDSAQGDSLSAEAVGQNLEKEGFFSEIKERRFYDKPSVQKKKKQAKAAKRRRKRMRRFS